MTARVVWAPVAFALGCFVYGLILSWHWPIVHDASIMHYVVFLMDHGLAPYRDIIDINMPGAYMTEWLAVHLLGAGDQAWRVFDLLEMLAALAACCVIAERVDWRAGLLAGLLLDMAHMGDGAIELGQRDWTVAVLLLAGYAFLLLALRRAQPAWMGAFALACGAAASVKPLAAVIPFLLLAFAIVELRRDGRRLLPCLVWSGAGAVSAAVLFVCFLAAYHATAAFIGMVRGLLAFYTGIGNMGYGLMAKLALGRFVTGLLIVAWVTGAALRMWRDRNFQLMGMGVVFGAALYFGQHKGYNYHRLTLLAFVLLAICTTSFRALQNKGAARWVGASMLTLILLYGFAHWTLAIHRDSFDLRMQLALQSDLRALGGDSLSGHVQCLEMVEGCVTDLYRMRLLQPTGFISDFFLFSPQPDAGMQHLRMRLMRDLTTEPPRVLVLVASDWGGGPAIYQPMDNWPAFKEWMGQHYRLAAERRGANGGIERGSYRVYALR